MKYCPNCGNANPDDAQFCPACGGTIAAPVQEAAPAAPAEPAAPAAPAPAAPAADSFAPAAPVAEPAAPEAPVATPAAPVAPVAVSGVSQPAQPQAAPVDAPQQPMNAPQQPYGAPQQTMPPIGAPQPMGTPFGMNQPMQPINSFEDFFEQFASPKTKNNVKWLGYICAFTAVVSIVLICIGNFVAILDVIFYGVFAFLLLKKKNWAFPLAVTCYSGIFSIIGFFVSGTPSGILALILSIKSTMAMKKLNDAYKEYQTTGQFPSQQI